jgi:hypothetical protein
MLHKFLHAAGETSKKNRACRKLYAAPASETAQESRACQKLHKVRATAEEIEGRTGGNEIYKAFQRLRLEAARKTTNNEPSHHHRSHTTIMGLTCLLECVLYE